MGCDFAATRITIIVLTSIYLVVGCVLLALGVWSVADYNPVTWLTLADLNANGGIAMPTAYLVTAAGGFMLITCILGIVAAAVTEKDAIVAYLVLGSILALAQLVTSIMALILYSWQTNGLRIGLQTFVITGYSVDQAMSEKYDFMQQRMRCCATSSRDDWVSLSTFWYSSGASNPSGWRWPTTCCILYNRDPTQTPIDPVGCETGLSTGMYIQGCHDPLSSWVITWSLGFGCLLLILFFATVGNLVAFGILLQRMDYPTSQVAPKGVLLKPISIF